MQPIFQLALAAQIGAASKKACQGHRSMYPAVGDVPPMTPPAWKAWRIRWNKRSKARKSISDAFEAYKTLHDEKSAQDIVKLAVQHPTTSAELPRAPKIIEHTKTGPLDEDIPAAAAAGRGMTIIHL